MASVDKEDEKTDSKVFRIWGIATVFIVALCLGYPWLLNQRYGWESENAGVFGDMYGALNALFGGIAFAALVATVLLQRNELQATRREMREQGQTAKTSARALSLSNRVQVYTGLLSADLELVKHHKRVYDAALQQSAEMIEDLEKRIANEVDTMEVAGLRSLPVEAWKSENSEIERIHELGERHMKLANNVYNKIRHNRAMLVQLAQELEAEEQTK